VLKEQQWIMLNIWEFNGGREIIIKILENVDGVTNFYEIMEKPQIV